VFIVAALYAAFVLKYDSWLLGPHRSLAQQLLPIVVGALIPVMALFGVYRGSWRMATVEDHGARASYRVLSQWNRRAAAEGEPVLIYGAGLTGTMAIREALTNPDLKMKPVGFIDDDPRLHRRVVYGFPVLGSLESLDEVILSKGITGVLIASDALPVETIVRVREMCEKFSCWLRYFRVDISPAEEWAIAAGMGPRLPIRKADASNVRHISRPAAGVPSRLDR
jgi:FlaA1/EpsC-like NDP-sugar epimerase